MGPIIAGIFGMCCIAPADAAAAGGALQDAECLTLHQSIPLMTWQVWRTSVNIHLYSASRSAGASIAVVAERLNLLGFEKIRINVPMPPGVYGCHSVAINTRKATALKQCLTTHCGFDNWILSLVDYRRETGQFS